MDNSIASRLENYINDQLSLKHAYDDFTQEISEGVLITLANWLTNKTALAFEYGKVSTTYFAGLVLK